MPTYQAPTIISAPHSPTRVIRASRQILMHSTSASLPLYLSPLSHRPKRPLWYSAPTFQRYSSLSPFLLPIPLRSSLLLSLPPHVNTTKKNHSVRVPLHLPLKLRRSGRVSHGEHLVLSNFTGVVGAYRCYVSVCNCLVWHLRFYSAWIKNYCVFWVFSALFFCGFISTGKEMLQFLDVIYRTGWGTCLRFIRYYLSVWRSLVGGLSEKHDAERHTFLPLCFV